MIEITLTPQEETRTPERSCFYLAVCEVDGHRYEAKKRLGAGNELARALVLAGIPDQPVRVVQPGIPGHLSWHSLHRMALYDYREGPGKVLSMVRWTPPPDFDAVFPGDAKNSGELVSDGVS